MLIWLDMTRNLFYGLKWFIQRGRRGWADCDIWNLNSNLERILAGALVRLADISHGHPCLYERPSENAERCKCTGGTVENMCAHKWVVMLYRNAELFNRLHRDEFWDSGEEDAVREEATQWLARWWGAL